MKNKILTLILLGTLGCLATNAVSVRTNFSRHGDKLVQRFSDDGKLLSKELIKADNSQANYSLQTKKNPQKEEEEVQPSAIHVTMKYPEGLQPEFIFYGEYLFGQNWFWSDYGEDDFYIELWPMDCPNILVAVFTKALPGGDMKENYFIFKEFDNFEPEMDVVFDASEATDLYRTEFVNETGEPFSFAYYERNPATHERTLVEPGELATMFGATNIFVNRENHNYILVGRDFDLEYVKNIATGKIRDDRSVPNIYMNRLPSGCGVYSFSVGQYTEDMNGLIAQTNTLAEPGLMVNQSDRFKVYENAISTDANPENIAEYCEKTYQISIASNNSLSSQYGIGFSDFTYGEWQIPFTLKACLPVASLEGLDVVSAFGSIALNQEWENSYDGMTQSPLISFDGETPQYINWNNSVGGNFETTPLKRQIGNYYYSDFTRLDNPFVASSPADYLSVAGNSVPMITFIGDHYEGPVPEEYAEYMFYLGFMNIGLADRSGFYRGGALPLTTLGYTVENGFVKYYISNESTLIDGKLRGRNETELVSNFAEEDFYPPTVQYLQIFDQEGKVSDRLEKPEDGTFGFYAGDFYPVFNEAFTEYQMDANEPTELTVEYAPFGTEQFQTLDVTLDPSKYFMPGFGYYYEGNLGNVTGKSSNGWFDLRFKLKDDAGNYQIQTLSPAFYIASADSGVNEIGDDTGSVIIDGNNILAPEGTRIYTMDGKLSDGTNLARGIYILRQGSKAQKIII